MLDINYNDKDFENKIINLDKSIKKVRVNGKIDDILKFCSILENVLPSVEIICERLEDVNREFENRGTYQGFNRSILNMVRKICKENISKNDYVVDMTVGNGHDTLFLAKLSKKVFGFDIQSIAINNTLSLLNKENVSNYELFLESHINIDKVLNKYKNNIKLILFNLGYLPCGDKSITTKWESTLEALKRSIGMIKDNGLVLMVFYPHEEGKMEAKAVLNYLNSYNIKYNVYKNTPNEDAPYLVVIS